MASVNFMKIHSVSEGCAVMRHCDIRERQKREHSNKDINKDLTPHNGQMVNRGYQETVSIWKDRIAELDRTTNTNKRKDRVELFALEIPIPADVGKENEQSFVKDALMILLKNYKKENVVNIYYHQDEQHDYLDRGETKTSLNHIHALVVPEKDGKLNGKAFSSKTAMKSINKQFDDLCRQKYNCKFHIYTAEERNAIKDQFGQKVEDLKRSTANEEALLYSAKNLCIDMILDIKDKDVAYKSYLALKEVIEPHQDRNIDREHYIR